MGRLLQSINQPLSLRSSIVTTGGLVASPFTGTVNIAVLLFLNLGTVIGPTAYMVPTNSATLGTSIAITKSGVYAIKLYLQLVEPINIVFGVSQDVAAAGLIGVPSFATAGFLDVQAKTTAAITPTRAEISTTAIVRPQDEGAGGSVIRFHATLSGEGGAPAAAFTQVAPYYTIRRVNDAHA